MPDANDFNAPMIEEFRAKGGKLGGNFEGAPVLLLHTRGAKSGKERVNPLMYLADGDRILVFATKGGADTNPDWYHNLVANPIVEVEVGTERYEATATVLLGDQRDRFYAEHAKRYPGFKEYEQRTSRVIPAVALERT